MLDLWNDGADDVYARRMDRGREPWLRRKLSLMFYRIINIGSHGQVPENVGDFRLLDRKCVNQLRNMREADRFTKGMYAWIGFRKAVVEYNRGDRVAGKSGWSLLRLFRLALNGLFSFTTLPLRMASILGMIISLAAFALGIFYGSKALLFGDPVAGFPTLIVAIFFIGGVQLLCLGIIGEYLNRIYGESKRRPVYIVNRYEGDNPNPPSV